VEQQLTQELQALKTETIRLSFNFHSARKFELMKDLSSRQSIMTIFDFFERRKRLEM
jgi:hypothetical protein